MTEPRPIPLGDILSMRVQLGPQGEDVRGKGEQQGSVRFKGNAWYIRFNEWQADGNGNLAYVQVERRVKGEFGNTERGRQQAQMAGYTQWVAPANATSAVPQGLASVEQFYVARFQVDHVDMLKKSGRQHYKTHWENHIKPTLGPVQMAQVAPQMVQALLSAKFNSGLSSQTIRHTYNCISAIFRHARGLRFYQGPLPTEGVRLPELTHKEKQAMTWEQVKLFADAITPKHRNLVIFLSQTGMRIGEASGLRWKHINLTDEWSVIDGEAIPPNSLLVCSNWTHSERTTTKNKSWRKIPLNSEAWVALTLHWEQAKFRGEEQPVFASRIGTPLNYGRLVIAVRKAAKKIGLPWVSLHCLRHTTATLADKVGLTVAEKQKILGHRTADMSLHYSHPEIERVRQAMEQMTEKPKLMVVKKGA